MDNGAKRLALRSITYGLHLPDTRDGDDYGAGGVNWLTQTSFEPPLVVVAVKAGSGSKAIIEKSGTFAVSTLRDDQLDVAKAFFRSTEVVDAGVRDADAEPLELRSTGMNSGG